MELYRDGIVIARGTPAAVEAAQRLLGGTTTSPAQARALAIPCGHYHGKYGCTQYECGYGMRDSAGYPVRRTQ